MALTRIVLPGFRLVSVLFRPPKLRFATSDHSHPFWEMGFVLSGACDWYFPKRGVLRLRSGEAVLIRPDQAHHERQSAGAATRLAWLGFTLDGIAPGRFFSGLHAHRRLRVDKHLGEILSILERIQRETVAYRENARLRIGLAITDLFILARRCQRRTARVPVEPGQRASVSHADALDAAAAYLNGHCTAPIRIEDVARTHGISTSHFTVLFRRRFGCAPKTYLLRCRMTLVQSLMLAGTREVKALAAQCGFTDAAHFCKWFKQTTGETPRQFSARNFGGRCNRRPARLKVEIGPYERHSHVRNWVVREGRPVSRPAPRSLCHTRPAPVPERQNVQRFHGRAQ